MKIHLPLLLAALTLHAADESLIRTLDNQDLKVTALTALPDGSLEYSLPDSKIRTRIPQGRYLYAWIPKPTEVEQADHYLRNGSLAQAAAAYKLAYDKYKLLGWDLYCIAKESEALAGLGEKTEAVRKLDQLKNYKLLNMRLVPHLNEIKRLNARLCIELGKYDDAKPLLDEMAAGNDDSNAAFAFLQKGNILRRKGNLKEASLMYLQATLLFPDSGERPEALYRLQAALTELKDPNAVRFANMLRKEYPDNPYTKRLATHKGNKK